MFNSKVMPFYIGGSRELIIARGENKYIQLGLYTVGMGCYEEIILADSCWGVEGGKIS